MSHTSVATLSIFKPSENTDSLSNSDSRSNGDSGFPNKTRSLSATRSSLRNSKQGDKNPLSVGEQRTRIPSTTRSSRNPVSKSASGSSVLERVKQTSDRDSSKRFGAVTVHAGVITEDKNAIKTYVVTCHTTANQLRDMVLDAYHVISPIRDGFYIELETCSGFGEGAQRTKLAEADHPLVKISNHAALDARFVLRHKQDDVTLLRIQDKSEDTDSAPVTYNVAASREQSSYEILQTITNSNRAEDHVLCTANQKQVTHLYTRNDLPLTILGHRDLELDGLHLEVHLISRVLNMQTKLDDVVEGKCNVDEGSQSTMSRLKDSLSKLREHLDTLQSKKQNDSSAPPVATENEPESPRNKKMEQYYRELGVESPREGSYEDHNVAYNESDITSTPGSRHGTNDSAYASDRVSHQQNEPGYGVDTQGYGVDTHGYAHEYPQRRESFSSEASSNEGRVQQMHRNANLKKSQSLLELKADYRTPRAYVHPQMTRGRVRGSTTDLQNIGADDHLTTWARRKQYDSNLRKVRTAEIVRRSQSFQTNNAKPPTEQRLSRDRPSSYHNKARRSLPQVPQSKQDGRHSNKPRQSTADDDDSSDNEIERELVTPHSRRVINGGEDPWSAEKLMQYKKQRRASIGSHPTKHRGMKTQLPYKQSTSHEALQQVICDLRQAAEKPYEPNNNHGSRVVSRAGSRTASRPVSSTSFSSIANDVHKDGANLDEGDMTYAQLEQWGIIKPSSEDVVMIKPTVSHATKTLYPTLHEVVATCDLISVVLESASNTGLGVQLFEATFNDIEPKSERRGVFRSPSGRRPLIGRKKGSAFVAVNRVQDSPRGMSLVAIDHMMQDGIAAQNGRVKEGDFIVEINNESTLSFTVSAVEARLQDCHGPLQLLLARLKYNGDKSEDGGPLDDLTKEYEKLQLKYESLKDEHEKHADHIAELQLDLRYSNKQLQQTQDQLLRQTKRIQEYDNEVFRREEAVNEWKYEANQRNIELARLKFESKQKEDRIAQLRSLLIQHTELMEINGISWGGEDIEDFEEHVSAV